MAKIRQENPEKRIRRVLSASSLSGDRVKSPTNEDLGKIKELMIDIPTGKVAYAVLSFGGVLGVGDKLFAVPWNALTLDEDEKEFVLSAEKATLESAPGFDKDSWPDMADPSWRSHIYQHYGMEPDWEEQEIERKIRSGGGGM